MRHALAIVSFAVLAVVLSACDKRDSTVLARTSTTKLESIHRGELSAIETYRQAIEKQGADVGILATLKSEHEDAAQRLRERLTSLGGKIDSTSGLWGGFAAAVEGTAKILGNKAAMEVLKQGEEHGVREYEEALKSSDIDARSEELIRTTLLPRQRDHVSTLASRLESK